MAKWRTYKNGITGHRYKGFYIIKDENKGYFDIIHEDKTILKRGVPDYDECEWIIDKEVAGEEGRKLLRRYYSYEIKHLSLYITILNVRREEKGLDKNEDELFEKLTKIRRRKMKNKEY